MRTTEERVAAVKQRAREIEEKRSRRRVRVISFAALAASLLIIVGLSFLIPIFLAESSTADFTQPAATASIFNGHESLGYILIGILAFALGAAITIFFYRIQHRNKGETDNKDGRAD